MTTVQIETYADIGQLAGADVDLKIILRRKVVPEFLEDVRFPSWARKYASLTVVAGTRYYDLAADFHRMRSIKLYSGTTESEIKYIGEDSDKVMLAENSTERAKPAGYYLTWLPGSTTLGWQRLYFDLTPDAAYTARYAYYVVIPFADDTTSVNLDAYIPVRFHWALVAGLKRYLYEIRTGVGDQRWQMADSEYQGWIERILANPEMANRSMAKFVD